MHITPPMRDLSTPYALPTPNPVLTVGYMLLRTPYALPTHSLRSVRYPAGMWRYRPADGVAGHVLEHVLEGLAPRAPAPASA
eukprot:1207430-Rhodomonas_salina.1